MGKGHYLGIPDVMVITAAKRTVDLSDQRNVYGFSVHVPADSANNAKMKINGSPSLSLGIGDPSQSFGGFSIGDCPVYYNAQLDFEFETTNAGNNSLILIITRIECVE